MCVVCCFCVGCCFCVVCCFCVFANAIKLKTTYDAVLLKSCWQNLYERCLLDLYERCLLDSYERRLSDLYELYWRTIRRLRLCDRNWWYAVRWVRICTGRSFPKTSDRLNGISVRMTRSPMNVQLDTPWQRITLTRLMPRAQHAPVASWVRTTCDRTLRCKSVHRCCACSHSSIKYRICYFFSVS